MIKYSYVLTNENWIGNQYIHLAIFNPINSGRLVNIEKVILNCGVIDDVYKISALRGIRCNLINLINEIPKATYGILSTYAPEPKAIITDGSSEIANGSDVFAIPGVGAFTREGITQSPQYEFFNKDGPMVLQEGEGLAIMEDASVGSNSYFNLMIYWDEIMGMKRYQD